MHRPRGLLLGIAIEKVQVSVPEELPRRLDEQADVEGGAQCGPQLGYSAIHMFEEQLTE